MSNKIKLFTIAGAAMLLILSVAISMFATTQNKKEAGSEKNKPDRQTLQRLPNNDPIVEQHLKNTTIEQLPILEEDVEIAYSLLLKRYFIRRKTATANKVIADFFTRNNIEHLLEDQSMIIFTDKYVMDLLISEEQRMFPDHPDTQEVDQ